MDGARAASRPHRRQEHGYAVADEPEKGVASREQSVGLGAVVHLVGIETGEVGFGHVTDRADLVARDHSHAARGKQVQCDDLAPTPHQRARP